MNLLSQQKAASLPQLPGKLRREGRGQWLSSPPSDTLTAVNRLTLKTESFLTDVNLIARPDLSWGLASVFIALLRLWEPLRGSDYADRLFDPGSKIEQITHVCFGKLLTHFPRHLSTMQETRNASLLARADSQLPSVNNCSITHYPFCVYFSQLLQE